MVYRVYVEKKSSEALEARALAADIRSFGWQAQAVHVQAKLPVKCLFTFSAPIKRLETVIYIPFFCAFGRIDLYINIAQYQFFQLTAHVYSFSVKVSFPLVSPQNRCTAPHSSATFSSINGF